MTGKLRKKTQIEQMDRGVYDIKNKVVFRSKTEEGLTEEIVQQISTEKEEPEWMLEYRLKALEIFNPYFQIIPIVVENLT